MCCKSGCLASLRRAIGTDTLRFPDPPGRHLLRTQNASLRLFREIRMNFTGLPTAVLVDGIARHGNAMFGFEKMVTIAMQVPRRLDISWTKQPWNRTGTDRMRARPPDRSQIPNPSASDAERSLCRHDSDIFCMAPERRLMAAIDKRLLTVANSIRSFCPADKEYNLTPDNILFTLILFLQLTVVNHWTLPYQAFSHFCLRTFAFHHST